MKARKTIDAQALREQAKKSEAKESFEVLERRRNCRIGVGVRFESDGVPSFFIEVLIKLCSGLSPLDLGLMVTSISLLQKLKSRGYSLNCEEDGCVSCELAVPPEKLPIELESCKSIVRALTL